MTTEGYDLPPRKVVNESNAKPGWGFAWTIVLVSLIGVALLFYIAIFRYANDASEGKLAPGYVAIDEQTVNDVALLKDRVVALDAAISAGATPSPNADLVASLTEVKTQLTRIDTRLKGLEDAISASPERALAVSAIRKDLEIMQKSQVEERTSVSSDLGRLYDFNKWFLATVATMALAVVGIAITNAFKKASN